MRRRRPTPAPVQLDDAVAEVTADYLAFLRTTRPDEPEDAKAFAARHAAAKTALSHIEQIIKLAASPAEQTSTETDSLLHEARHQMGQDRDSAEEPERDGEAG
jgi:hypothetical protein